MKKRDWMRQAQDELGSLCDGIDLNVAWVRYIQHRLNCTDKLDTNGEAVQMKMTFVEWLRVWVESGHWQQRGRGRFVMARHNDVGHYEVGNVSIKSSGENVRDALIGRPLLPETKQKISESNSRPSPATRLAKCVGQPTRKAVVFMGVAYPSIGAAHRATGIDRRIITRFCPKSEE